MTSADSTSKFLFIKILCLQNQLTVAAWCTQCIIQPH